MRKLTTVVAAVVIACICSCGRGEGEAGSGQADRFADRSIKLATTTSTDNSGLLAVLLPRFAEKYGIEVKVIAVGTGKAIRHGENGDVDVLLVHAREAEEKFVSDGFGVNRRAVMHNDFVVVGPADDPAGIGGMTDVAQAFGRVAAAGSFFVSRGDESGTHKREKALWRAAGAEPGGEWYLAAGQGMGAVLTLANEKRAYTITDRGTYLAYRGKLDLPVLVEGDERLYNPYGVIAVNPARHPHVRYVDAMAFVGWLTSREGQEIIGAFSKEGELLFHPDAVTGE